MIGAPLTIINGLIQLPEGKAIKGALRTERDRIAALGPDVKPQEGDFVFDAKGKLVTPGLVDLGTFAIDKPAFHFGGITRAAINVSIKTNWCGPKVAMAIETATRGKIKRSALRPDLWKPRKKRQQ